MKPSTGIVRSVKSSTTTSVTMWPSTCVKDGGASEDNLSARGAGVSTLSAEAYATFANEVGAAGRSQQEIRDLVALALHPPKAEMTVLCESIGTDGRLNLQRLDALDDSGRISRSAWRRAKDAEQRVLGAFQRGQITPAMMATGAPLRLALSDAAAFKSLVEDRPAMYKPERRRRPRRHGRGNRRITAATLLASGGGEEAATPSGGAAAERAGRPSQSRRAGGEEQSRLAEELPVRREAGMSGGVRGQVSGVRKSEFLPPGTRRLKPNQNTSQHAQGH